MSDQNFIDGLKPRGSEKQQKPAQRISTRHTKQSLTTFSGGDPLVMKERARKLSREKILEQHRKAADDFMQPVQAFSLGKSKKEALQDNFLDNTPRRSFLDDTDLKKKYQKETPRRRVGEYSGDYEMSLNQEELNAERREKRRKKRSKNKKSKLMKRALAVLTILILGGGVIGYFWGDAIVSKITGGKSGLLDLFRSAILADGSKQFRTDADGRTNILIFGTSGYDMQGTEGDYVHDGAQLTDSIMVLSFNQKTGDSAMVSVQRDLLVGTCTNAGKINEIYYCANMDGNNEEAGANALRDKVRDVIGTDLHYYVHIDWSALISLVDALGGITVTLDEPVEDDWTDTFIQPNTPTRLNGERALALARARHGTNGGDFTRANNQQKIMLALRDRAVSKGFNIVELINVASVLGDNVRTDLSAEEIAAGAKLMTTLDLGSMRQVPLLGTEVGDLLTTETISGISYVIPSAGAYNYGDLRNYVKDILNNVSVKETANIVVLNGSGEPGVASAEKDELENSGFSVGEVGNAPAGLYLNHIYLYNISNRMPKTLDKLEKYYNLKALPRDELPEDIETAGVDFVIIIGVND